ncbi:glucokinase [Deminuibacter soli]|uniref:Glucokinase n=1 Tax=Deminuibacter soli TaxID=2291815 RepID=A0A3E1NQN2_9BACT|nr:glucokinase [Deminuibacter soli]RFM30236.1 glucokinase [Deminuibacter soli]
MIPIAVYGKQQTGDTIQYVLAADVGGTKANLALVQVEGLKMQLLKRKKYPSQEYASFIDIITDFIQDVPHKPGKICVGVAGPVINGEVEFTNLSWMVSEKELSRETGVTAVALINDLEATAYGLATLPDEDFTVLHAGNGAPAAGNIAIIAPGTGLGEAALFFDGRAFHPFATEGGHTGFAPRTALDYRLLQYLQQQNKVVSWEHVIAGPAIYVLYQFLRDAEKMQEPEWLTKLLAEGKDPSAVVSSTAIEKQEPLCVKTMELYIRYLGYESTNLVLKMKASGGLYISGGIPPKILPLLQQPAYYAAYCDCDRMNDLVEAVPIRVIMNDHAPLFGAAYYGAHGI